MGLERRNADSSSNRGMVWPWSGATVVLVATIWLMHSVSVFRTMYPTAVYVLVDASQNPQSVADLKGKVSSER